MLEPSRQAAGNRRIEIHQIFYSDETRLLLDPGFIPLDNRDGRADWREYWPIRTFLFSRPLKENTLYGFLSPRFAQKTLLDSNVVNAFIASVPANTDVISFSPYFDQGAFHLNTFEQAATNHPDIWRVFESAVPYVAPGFDPHTLAMDSRSSIFCNYFVATPAFWRRWLLACEMLLGVAEGGNGELAALLNGPVAYGSTMVPAKVFVIERIASLLLATEPHWRAARFDPLSLPMSGSIVCPYPGELAMLDALKLAAIETGDAGYLEVFERTRGALVDAAIEAKRAVTQ
ncbi:hypothetical protein PXJ20_01885 [Paraburkholderia sp. A1RI_3L]|uniref:hypothetical protein n=1 Tax=Paraburkholderia TaxID=1822464 RepID=UPI00034A9669|nr:hypothetical protein [Paraburkholderia kururiensis]